MSADQRSWDLYRTEKDRIESTDLSEREKPRATETVSVVPGERRTVEMAPRMRFDPGADGWYGADLHVRMNSGEPGL